MKLKIFTIGLFILTLAGLWGCKKQEIEIKGDGILYLNDIEFSEYMAAGPAKGTLYAKFYTATDTSSSLIVSETSTDFTINNLNKHSQIQGYNLPDKIKKIEFTVSFNMGEYAAKKVNIKNTTFRYKGNNIFSEDNIHKESATATGIFILDTIIVNFD